MKISQYIFLRAYVEKNFLLYLQGQVADNTDKFRQKINWELVLIYSFVYIISP